MKKLLVVFVCFLFASAGWALDSDGNQSDDYNSPTVSTIALDEQLNQGVIISPQDPAITSIVERMDEAQANGEVVLFRQLLSEYKILNPQIEIKDGPQVSSGVVEPKTKSRWIGDDIEVDSAYAYQSFSMDTRNDTTIYLVASRMLTDAAEYKIPIWYSNDGITWNATGYELQWGGHDLLNPSLKIVETPDTDYIFVAFEAYQTSSPYGRDILVFRSNLVDGGINFSYPAANAAIDEMDPSLDADDVVYPSSPYLHLAFESDDSIAYIRSTDRGATWVDRAIIGVGSTTWNYFDPSLAYGPTTPTSDSMNLGVAWSYQYSTGEQMIRFKRNRYKGQSDSWLSTEYFTTPAGCFDDNPSLKMTHSTMNSAAIVFARLDTSGTDEEQLCNFYTYDAGRNWSVDMLYYVGSTYEALPTLAMDDAPNDYHVFFKGTGDDIRYKEAHYNDFAYAGWTTSISIADSGNISDVTPPASAVRAGEPCVCWKTDAPGWKLMFDALWLTSGVDEKQDISAYNGKIECSLDQNIIIGTASLRYTLPGQTKVDVSLINILGRKIATLDSGEKSGGEHTLSVSAENLSQGIYYIVIETETGLKGTAKTAVLK